MKVSAVEKMMTAVALMKIKSMIQKRKNVLLSVNAKDVVTSIAVMNLITSYIKHMLKCTAMNMTPMKNTTKTGMMNSKLGGMEKKDKLKLKHYEHVFIESR